MKKILILVSLIFLVIGVNAQAGRLRTLTIDSLKGNNNETLAVIPVTGTYSSLFVSVTVDRISTAAGGTLVLKSGVETASVLTNNHVTNPSYGFTANDSLVTTDVAAQYWSIYVPNPEATLYHIYGDGDVNDTVQVTTKYFLKK